mmetsp:Transcript_49517/g.124187  ORF Transcript_49517/g.124187 Transcript_49517/m.124187 type:complete len:411 (-) Transcript_49517:7-1239(-)
MSPLAICCSASMGPGWPITATAVLETRNASHDGLNGLRKALYSLAHLLFLIDEVLNDGHLREDQLCEVDGHLFVSLIVLSLCLFRGLRRFTASPLSVNLMFSECAHSRWEESPNFISDQAQPSVLIRVHGQLPEGIDVSSRPLALAPLGCLAVSRGQVTALHLDSLTSNHTPAERFVAATADPCCQTRIRAKFTGGHNAIRKYVSCPHFISPSGISRISITEDYAVGEQCIPSCEISRGKDVLDGNDVLEGNDVLTGSNASFDKHEARCEHSAVVRAVFKVNIVEYSRVACNYIPATHCTEGLYITKSNDIFQGIDVIGGSDVVVGVDTALGKNGSIGKHGARCVQIAVVIIVRVVSSRVARNYAGAAARDIRFAVCVSAGDEVSHREGQAEDNHTREAREGHGALASGS